MRILILMFGFSILLASCADKQVTNNGLIAGDISNPDKAIEYLNQLSEQFKQNDSIYSGKSFCSYTEGRVRLLNQWSFQRPYKFFKFDDIKISEIANQTSQLTEKGTGMIVISEDDAAYPDFCHQPFGSQENLQHTLAALSMLGLESPQPNNLSRIQY